MYIIGMPPRCLLPHSEDFKRDLCKWWVGATSPYWGLTPLQSLLEQEEGNPSDSVSSWAHRNAGLKALLNTTK